MAYTANNTETRKSYVCRTQVGPTFGVVPLSQTNEDDDDDEDQPAVVGYGAIVPRWAVSHPAPTKLLYFVDGPTFDSDADAKFVAQAVFEATTEWNKLQFGVIFAATSTRADANFNVTYAGSSPASCPELWATAFFPSQQKKDRDVKIYSYALETGNQADTAKVLLHELGHVLGLRHEFAISNSESPAAVEIGQSNAASVMSYRCPPVIQKSDIDAIKEFYSKYKDGDMIDNVPVVDETPQARNTP